jgi:hypothetical protein
MYLMVEYNKHDNVYDHDDGGNVYLQVSDYDSYAYEHGHHEHDHEHEHEYEYEYAVNVNDHYDYANVHGDVERLCFFYKISNLSCKQ